MGCAEPGRAGTFSGVQRSVSGEAPFQTPSSAFGIAAGGSAPVTTSRVTGWATISVGAGGRAGACVARCCQLSHSWGESVALRTTGLLAPAMMVAVSVAISPLGR